MSRAKMVSLCGKKRKSTLQVSRIWGSRQRNRFYEWFYVPTSPHHLWKLFPSKAKCFSFKCLPSQSHKTRKPLKSCSLYHKKKRETEKVGGRSHKPGLDMRLMRERGPSNFQLSSSKDLTSLFSAAIRSDFSTATNILGKRTCEYLTTSYVDKQQHSFPVAFSVKCAIA